MYSITLFGPMNAYEELEFTFDSEDVAEAFYRGIRDMDQYSRHEITLYAVSQLSTGRTTYCELICD